MKRIVLPGSNSLIYLNLDEVCHFESAGRKTKISFLREKEALYSSASLKEIEGRLKHTTFLRVHKSHIINILHIKRYAKGRDSYLLLDNGEKVDIGRTYKERLNQAINLFLK